MVLNEFFSGAIVDDYRVSQVITWGKNQVFTCSKTCMAEVTLLKRRCAHRLKLDGQRCQECLFAEMRSDDEKRN